MQFQWLVQSGWTTTNLETKSPHFTDEDDEGQDEKRKKIFPASLNNQGTGLGFLITRYVPNTSSVTFSSLSLSVGTQSCLCRLRSLFLWEDPLSSSLITFPSYSLTWECVFQRLVGFWTRKRLSWKEERKEVSTFWESAVCQHTARSLVVCVTVFTLHSNPMNSGLCVCVL